MKTETKRAVGPGNFLTRMVCHVATQKKRNHRHRDPRRDVRHALDDPAILGEGDGAIEAGWDACGLSVQSRRWNVGWLADLFQRLFRRDGYESHAPER